MSVPGLRTAACLCLVILFAISPAAAQHLLVADAAGNRAVLLDPFTGSDVATFATGAGPHEIAVSPDGRFAYVANAGGPAMPRSTTITVIDLTARRQQATFDMGDRCNKPHDLRVSADGALLLVACAEARAVVELDARTGQIRESWPVERDGAWMLAVSADARTVVTANLEGESLSIIDRRARTTRVIARGGGQLGLEITPDGRTAWSASAETGADSIFVVDLATDSLIRVLGTEGDEPVRIRFTPDGYTAVVSNSGSRTVTLYRTRDVRPLASIHLPYVPKVLSLSPDGRWAAVSHPDNAAVSIIDAAGRQLLRTIPVSGTPDGVAWVPAAVGPDEPGEQDPAWSPDGTRLVFTSERSGDREVHVMPAAGGRATRLTAVRGRDAHPAFSPDGNWIAFQSPRDGSEAEIYVMPATGGAARRLTHLNTFAGVVSWAPDGQRIAFQALMPHPGGGRWWQIFVIDSIGGTPRQLTRGPVNYQVPRWSRDGSRLVIFSDISGSNELYSIEPFGGAMQRITHNDWEESAAAWLPDGRLVFISERLGERGIYIVRRDGSGEQLLHAGNVWHGVPEPSPDGRRITFVKRLGGRTVIHVLDLEAGTVQPLFPEFS